MSGGAAAASAVSERAVAVVDVGAVRRNCARLARELTGGATLCAVVKANGYGHGAVECSRAALAGGATQLAVAAASEAADLRAHLPDAPLLVMGALTPGELDVALRAEAEIALWREEFLDLVARRASELGIRARIHVKYDTGMGRLGERDPEAVAALARHAAESEVVELAGLWTHFATADEPDSAFFDEQLERFRALALPLAGEYPGVRLHAANSAATLREPAAHLDMVRCGIAVYGLDPFHRDPFEHGLEPALELRSHVADVKRFPPGATAGYGRRWSAPSERWVGVLPIGYADGVRRGLSDGGEALVGGQRHPIVGTISMDNTTVDLGPETAVGPGAPAVLIGVQGEERILCEEVAERLGTINYEITCGISPRVKREYRE
jgi:alanine racemase